VGWFPSNYTQEEIDDPHTYCMAENVMDVMVALYPFKAQNDTELSFAKGDRLEVLDRPASDPEWFKVSRLWIRISCRIRYWGSVTFWCGSGSGFARSFFKKGKNMNIVTVLC
jgi:hypothetical protein